MPELPEVETTRRLLAPVMEGATIDRVEVTRDRMLRRQPRPREFADRLVGRTVERLGRRGKFLLGQVEGDLVLVVHLGMSGRMSIDLPSAPQAAHTHVVFRFGSVEVRMVDPRTFGFVACLTPEEWAGSPLARLGPDALDHLPSRDALAALLGRRQAPIKALLLDQRIVAGIGNIYADEILHRARLHPRRPGASLDAGEVGRLRAAVRPVLEAGLTHGGTSLGDLAYLLPDGRVGEFTTQLRAYGRTDLPCLECGAQIERTVVGQRSSHFCPVCQPSGPASPPGGGTRRS